MKIKQFLSTIEGLATNTRNAYEQTLWQLHSRIKGEEPTPKEISTFLHGYGASSLHRHKAAIKAYLEYRYPKKPWPFTRRDFAAPRQEIIRCPPLNIVNALVDNAENEDDRMFVLTLFNLGCRIRELMGIEEADISPAGVQVLAKGNTYRLKVITKEFHPLIAGYARGKKGRIFPRPYSYYNEAIKRLGAKVGYPQITLHMLRHARAVDLLMKKMPLAFVQQFLGHANINTTARYLLIVGGELGEQLEKVEANHA